MNMLSGLFVCIKMLNTFIMGEIHSSGCMNLFISIVYTVYTVCTGSV